MTNKKLLIAALLACAFAPAIASEMDGDAEPRGEPRIETHVVRHGEHPALPMFFPGPQLSRKLVKNAPYSAEVVTERQQDLADGNQIANTTRALSYRDSAGRTRQETRSADGEVRSVTIRDVDGSAYILSPRTRTATRLGGSPEIARAAAERARARIEQLRKEGKLPAPERKGAEGEQVIVKRVERVDSDGQARVKEDVRVQVAPRAGDHAAAAIHLGPMLARAFGATKWAANATTKDLGTREFDGIKATGKMRSYEIPAGELGNRNPIVVSSETWYSPDLQVTVYSKHSDPRSGDFIYRLDNVKREEPPAALFTVPSDYTVKDLRADVRKRLERKAE